MTDAEAKEMEMQAQASEWVVRMHAPDCTDAERTACLSWRAQSAMHEATFRGMDDLWGRSALLADPRIVSALREAERDRASGRIGGIARLIAPLAIAAALVLVALAAVMFQRQKAPSGVLHYATVLGEQRRVELPDGTSVVLDTDTALVAQYSGRERRIELTAGQAQFAVKSDAERPFVVAAGGGLVTAVGTEFTVRVEEAAATVTLLEGTVVVNGPADAAERHAPATLSPGQQLRFARDGEWTTATVDLDAARAWTEGHVFATDWPLDRLVAEMNRYSQTKLRVADPALAQLRISGGFRASDPRGLALVLEHSLPVRAEETGGEIVLMHRPTQRQ